MKQLIITVGLPRSGKSTWARFTGYPIVNRDSIRLAMHGEAFLKPAENWITVIEDTMVDALFRAGHPVVIVDACHGTQRMRDRWKFKGYEIVFKVFPVNVELCKQRAIDTHKPELIAVIDRMFKNFELNGVSVQQILGDA